MTDLPGHGGGPAPDYGRVDADGNVYVITSAGERFIAQWLQGDPQAGLAFYRRRFEGLEVEVDLLEQRVKTGAIPPDEATKTVRKVRRSVVEAQAVGDLDGLLARLDSLGIVVDAKRRAQAEEARRAKTELVATAEKLSTGTDWRGGANALRDLLTTWKALPRLDRQTDDELWHRFSAARSVYTRRRKEHFAALNETREAARVAKEKLADEAAALASSTDWGETARAYRDLMSRWKAAGGAQKDVDDALWKRFRGAQDAFFGARDAANAALDKELTANAVVKRGLLVEAEHLLPVGDPKRAREMFRELATRWDAAGKVSRNEMKDLEGRFGAIEQTIRGAEDHRWRSSNPEAHARAAATVAQLERSIASLATDLRKAAETGNTRRADQARADIAARESWLDEARKALEEFSPR